MRPPLPGVDELDKQLSLRHKAATAAEEGAISASDTAFDNGQQTIVQHMEDMSADWWTKNAENLEGRHARRGEISAEIGTLPRQKFADAVDASVEIALRSEEERLKRTQRAEDLSLRALKAYRLRCNITRSPHYPKWRVLHWAIVVTMFLLESIANANFFGNASPFGLIGGFLQAAIISATNIGLGLLGGMVIFPWRNDRQVKEKSTAPPTATAILVGFFLLVFNLATAHYRVLLEQQPDEAMALAIPHLFAAPLAIDNFDAWVLLFVGIIFATVAWIEGYKSDDPLRDYGRLHREYEEHREENAKTKSEIRASAVKEYQTQRQVTQQTVRTAKQLLSAYRREINESKATAANYQVWRQKIEDTTNTLLNRYQEYYLTVDPLEPRPKYFSDTYRFPEDRPFQEETDRLQQAADEAAKYDILIDALETIVNDAAKEESAIVSQIQKSVDDFFERIKGVAVVEAEDPTHKAFAAGA